MKKLVFMFLFFTAFGSEIRGQTVEVPFDSPQWDTSGANFVLQNYQGEESVLLLSGKIFLKDLAFLNGVIEVDINFSAARNFPGIGFRMVDPQNYENFYIRPHQSGNPDANQYTPVFDGLANWQLYHGKKYATAIDYTFNQWHHIKIEVSGNQANIFFDDMEDPLLEVQELLRAPEAGTLALISGNLVHFANFKYTPKADTESLTAVEKVSLEGLINEWQVASTVQKKGSFQEQTSVSSSDLKNLQWTKHQVESSGVLNLGRYLTLSNEENVAVVKLDIQSDAKQIKELNFGYSDFVKVFVNGQALYSGATNFQSRDYRYLGTVGYFDTLYLPLRKGKNEVLLVVSENFGGWGVQGIIKDRKGIRVN